MMKLSNQTTTNTPFVFESPTFIGVWYLYNIIIIYIYIFINHILPKNPLHGCFNPSCFLPLLLLPKQWGGIIHKIVEAADIQSSDAVYEVKPTSGLVANGWRVALHSAGWVFKHMPLFGGAENQTTKTHKKKRGWNLTSGGCWKEACLLKIYVFLHLVSKLVLYIRPRVTVMFALNGSQEIHAELPSPDRWAVVLES